MHTEETECVFWATSLSVLGNYEYAYLARDGDEYYFLKKQDNDYVIKKVETLDDSCISDRMREDFDAHDAWVEAVRNGDTDDSYDDRQQDVDIWEEMNSDDYYGCNDQICHILHSMWLWRDDVFASDWRGYYLDECNTWTVTPNVLDSIYRHFNTEAQFNEELWSELEAKYWVHQVEFLAAEPIR